MVAGDSKREDVIIPEDLANPGYYTYSRQALLRYMGYGDHEYQNQIERRRIIERAYNANFPTGHLSDANLIEHIENYGPPESKERFDRICSYLTRRGMSLIEANVEKRVDENHRSFRQVHQTFEDGMWFVRTFGPDYGYIGFGRLISEAPPSNTHCMQAGLPPEPLLVFEKEALPTFHAIFLREDGPPKFCRGASESKEIQFKEDRTRWTPRIYDDEKKDYLMRVDENGDVTCSSCGSGYFSDTAVISEQKYSSHAHLIRRRFEIRDFVNEDEFNREWTRHRGRLDPEAEAAIAKAFLSDHIAPMRADADEMAGIPGDPIKRYGLDRVAIGPNATEPPIEQKSRWPHEVKRDLSSTLLVVDRAAWEGASEDERISMLKGMGAHTMRRFRDAAQDDLRRRIRFRDEREFEELIKHVRRELKARGSSFAVAGRGGGVRYAMFAECFECHKQGVAFGDGHECECSKCRVQFTGIRCDRPECLLNRSGTVI